MMPPARRPAKGPKRWRGTADCDKVHPTVIHSNLRSEAAAPASRLPRNASALILALFVLSGAVGLVYQVIWIRMLTLVFGNTVQAASTVVASFMAGLALGSWRFGRRADRGGNMLRMYGLLEGGVGIYALLLPLLLQAVYALYTTLFRSFGESVMVFSLARFVISFALLIAPSTLMGATLPVLVRAFVRERRDLGRRTAILYALNTLGATAGCFATGFVLIEHVGVTATNYLAAAVSLIIAAACLLLARGVPAVEPGGETPEPPATAEAGGAAWLDYGEGRRRIILAAVALIGFASLAYEVLWTRVIIYVVSASTEAFAIVLTTFLAGIGLGSLLVTRRVDRFRRPLAVLGTMEVGIGIAAVLSVPLLSRLFDIQSAVGRAADPGFWGWTAIRFVSSAAVIAVPTLLMGAAFPVAVAAFVRSARQVGSNIGALYAMSTLGSVAGSLAGGFLLLPALGAQRSILLMAFTNIAVGVTLWAAEHGRRPRTVAAAAGLALAPWLAGLLLIPANSFLLLYNRSRSTSALLHVEEEVTATVTVHEFPTGTRVIATNGVDVAGTDTMLRTTQKLQGHLPLLIHPPGPRVLQIGFGSGETSRIVLLEGAEHLDVAEICAGVVRAAPWFADINDRIWEKPRFRPIIMDAKNYALLTAATYDIIMNDSIHPRVAGNASLYTVDYFRDCRRRIAPGGLMSSWLPVYGMREEELRMLYRSFLEVFPHATLWMAHNMVNRHALLLAPVDDVPLRIDYQAFAARIARPEIAADLADLGLDDPVAMLTTLAMDEETLREFTRGGELNTDEHPLLEYRVPKYTEPDEVSWANCLEAMLGYRSGVRPLLTNLPADPAESTALEARLDRWTRASHVVVAAMVKGLRADPTAVQEFERAREIEPQHIGALVALGRRERVIEQREAQLAAQPGDPAARAQLAEAYWRAGRRDEALREMEAAGAAAAADPEITRRIGDMRRALADLPGALESYRRAEQLRPDHVETLIGHADALMQSGSHADAAARYRRAMELDPRRFDLPLRLAAAQSAMGAHREALESYLLAIGRSPHSVEALNGAALLEAAAGRHAEAAAHLRQAMQADARHPDAYNNLAFLLAERGRELDEALRLARRATELDASAGSFDTLAWVHHKRGEGEAAREAIARALELAARDRLGPAEMRALREHERAIGAR